MELDNYNFSIEENQENSLKDILFKYLYNWKWFLLSALICVVLGFVYVRYQVPVYEVNATILIKDDKKGGSISDELSAFEDLGILKNGKNIDNEIEILKSRALMRRVVNELRLDISYYANGRPIEHERFFDTPIIINYTVSDSTDSEKYGNWIIVPKSAKTFELKNADTEEAIGTFNFGENVEVPSGKIEFSTTKFFSSSCFNKDFRIMVSPVDQVVNRYLGSILINPVNKTSNAITIRLRDPLADKAAAIVDNLIKQHNLDAVADKNQVSKNTADFINERIHFITSELSDVEEEAEDFKVRYKLTDVESEARLFLETGSKSEMNQLDATTQVRVAEFMNDYIKKHDNATDLIPANIGLSDPALANQINDYNKLVLEHNRILKNAGIKNPMVEDLESQINNIRHSVKESLINLQNTLQIKVREIAKKENEINSKIGTVPKYERQYRSIQRQQQIKEALYLYLLQKREETNIALAVTVANAKVVDQAYSNGEMVAPKKKIIYLTSFLIGLIIPIIILYILQLLDTKVHGKRDFDKIQIPFLGDIPQNMSKERIVVTANSNSNIAEAFRLLRTNMEFITSSLPKGCRTVFITSTIGKEGKSLIALNLAASFAITGKKTLLIGADLRAPKILEYLDLSERNGLTSYIKNHDLKIDDIIFKMHGLDNFDILSSGPIPPNPAELLIHARVNELFDLLKSSYEWIIVDTAPVGLVADTLLMSANADCTIFVTRANYLDKRLLRIAETLNREKRLPKMGILINGLDAKKGYGYGYRYGGYGYGNEKEKSGWKKFFKK